MSFSQAFLRHMLGTHGTSLLDRNRGDPLDKVLFHWPTGDPFTVRDLLRSVAIFGQTGSGKSSSSGLLFARAIIKLAGSGGLILVSKPEDGQFWIDRFNEAGRIGDLITFGPDGPARCNFLDFEMKCGGDARSLTEFLLVTGEGLSQGGAGEDGKFWELSKKRMLYNAIEPCRLAHGEISLPMIQQFIATAAAGPAQLSGKRPDEGGDSPREKWEKQSHHQTMRAAHAREKTAVELHDFNLYSQHWTNEYIFMEDKVRSSILADVMNVLHTYNSGIVREMVSTTTSVTPKVMARGKWVMVDFPLDRYGDSGKLIMHGWKMLTQKYILRRHAKPGESVIVIHADEAQQMVNSYDPEFLAKCRSHLGCMIYLTQSIHGYLGEGK